MYCRKCGIKLQDEWKVCPNCGEPVNDVGQNVEGFASETEGPESHKKIKFYRKWPFWIIILVICAIVAFLLLNMMGQNKNISNDEEVQENTEKTEEKEVELVTDFSEQDFSTLLGKTEADLENSGLIEKEDTGEYSAMDGSLLVKIKDGQVNEIVITGDEKTAPVFGTVALGTTGDEAKTKLVAGYPESQDFTDGFKLLNLDTKGSVECTLTEDKVSKIRYIQLSDEEIEAFNTAKEEKLRAEYIFPDSDKKYLSEDEIRTKTVDEMLIGRNEIFARHGYIFTDENLKNHFESTSWYEGTIPAEQFNLEQVFNDFEKKNVELIKQVEDEINGVPEDATQGSEDTEAQKVIEDARAFVVGKQFHLKDSQLAVEFTDAGEFIAIGYYGSDPLTNKYCTYEFSAKYAYHKDVYQYLTYVTIEGVEYYFRYFTNGNISLDGDGEFSGWYEQYQ